VGGGVIILKGGKIWRYSRFKLMRCLKSGLVKTFGGSASEEKKVFIPADNGRAKGGGGGTDW